MARRSATTVGPSARAAASNASDTTISSPSRIATRAHHNHKTARHRRIGRAEQAPTELPAVPIAQLPRYWPASGLLCAGSLLISEIEQDPHRALAQSR